MIPRLALPPAPAVLALIALAFIAPGLAGHDPWKSFDAIGIEIAHQMLLSGDLIVPRVAGEPWLEDAPFYHWIALGFGKLLGWAIPFHNAARLASGLCMLLAVYFLHRVAGPAAPLLLIGSIGLFVHAHEAIPDLAGLAAICAAYAVLPRAHERPLWKGAAFGAALGLAALGGSWIVPAALAAAVLAAHAVCAPWRSRKALPFLAAAGCAAALVAASWPLALAQRAPDLVGPWWYLATHARGELWPNLRYFLVTTSWFAWPAWPLAAWALWALRHHWREPRLFVPGAAFALSFAAVVAAGPPQDVTAIALLAPLALLGAEGAALLRRGAAAALDWFGVMTFTFSAALIWLGYFALMSGAPARIHSLLTATAPGIDAPFTALGLVLGLALTLGWLYIAFFTAPSPLRGVTRWTAGVALLWGTFAALLMPWADHQKSYRGVALQLRSKIPVDAGCITGQNLGVTQRAALSYHAGLRTMPLDLSRPDACRLLLVQGNPRDERDGPSAAWTKVADVGRPGDKAERYRLYRLDAK
jgi:4-amino-4-deoxy-L-arabinose transferase-like glycosyltransferase